LKSIDEATTLLLTISDFPTKNLETLDQILTTESSIYESIKIAELQSQLESVSEKLFEKASEIHNLEVKCCLQEKELDALKILVNYCLGNLILKLRILKMNELLLRLK
jgi:hypothetical protein